jgi:hypothetical protein
MLSVGSSYISVSEDASVEISENVRCCRVLGRSTLIESHSVDNVSINLVVAHCFHHR